MPKKVYVHSEPFVLENSAQLAGFELAYQTWGTRNATDSNIIWVCHALTGDADVAQWWPGLVGKSCALDPNKDFIICANMLGSCYGSTNALSVDPSTNEVYYHDFPTLTNRDIVRAFDALREALNIKKIKLIIGGSTGGQHVLEWAILCPDLFEYLVPVATNAVHSPWAIAFNETQRMCIAADSTWMERSPEAGIEGLKAARATALLSYRSYESYLASQQEADISKMDKFRASSYQQYQGEKLANRFHAFAYWTLSMAMDSHNVGRGRGGVSQALKQVKARTLVIAIDSDLLFPPIEQKTIADGIKHARFEVVRSPKGHDGFLLEFEALNRLIRDFMGS